MYPFWRRYIIFYDTIPVFAYVRIRTYVYVRMYVRTHVNIDTHPHRATHDIRDDLVCCSVQALYVTSP
jgi:hypothetical protein